MCEAVLHGREACPGGREGDPDGRVDAAFGNSRSTCFDHLHWGIWPSGSGQHVLGSGSRYPGNFRQNKKHKNTYFSVLRRDPKKVGQRKKNTYFPMLTRAPKNPDGHEARASPTRVVSHKMSGNALTMRSKKVAYLMPPPSGSK